MQVYGSSKFALFPDHIAALRDGRLIAPVHVRIKPINKCNHACWYCAYRADNLALGEDMNEADRISEPKMREIVDDLIRMGVKAVTFSGGGEPLLYKTLPDHIRKLAEGGVRVASLTNGANLKGRMADAFAEYGTWVRVSVDAWDDGSYAASRGIKPGAYTSLIQNLTDFGQRAAGQCPVDGFQIAAVAGLFCGHGSLLQRASLHHRALPEDQSFKKAAYSPSSNLRWNRSVSSSMAGCSSSPSTHTRRVVPLAAPSVSSPMMLLASMRRSP